MCVGATGCATVGCTAVGVTADVLVAPVEEEVAEPTDVVPAAVGVELAVAAAVAVVAGAVAVDVVSVVEALGTSEAGDPKGIVDVNVAEADGKSSLAAGFDLGCCCRSID